MYEPDGISFMSLHVPIVTSLENIFAWVPRISKCFRHRYSAGGKTPQTVLVASVSIEIVPASIHF